MTDEYNGIPVPRDVTCYEPSSHFWQRLKYRRDPAPTKAIAEACIEDGELKRSHMENRVIFEHEQDGHTWRVVAALLPEQSHHYLITIYAVGAHGDVEHKEVFDL